MDKGTHGPDIPFVVGRTGDDTRKSPIITLYEPYVGLIYYTLSGTFIHEHNTTSLGTLTKLNHAASPHCYIYMGFSRHLYYNVRRGT